MKKFLLGIIGIIITIGFTSCTSTKSQEQLIEEHAVTCKEHFYINSKIDLWAKNAFYSKFNKIEDADNAKAILEPLKTNLNLIKGYQKHTGMYYQNKRKAFKKGCNTSQYKSPYTIFKNGSTILSHYKDNCKKIDKCQIQNFNDFFNKNQHLLED